jgi:hypothetical protein
MIPDFDTSIFSWRYNFSRWKDRKRVDECCMTVQFEDLFAITSPDVDYTRLACCYKWRWIRIVSTWRETQAGDFTETTDNVGVFAECTDEFIPVPESDCFVCGSYAISVGTRLFGPVRNWSFWSASTAHTARSCPLSVYTHSQFFHTLAVLPSAPHDRAVILIPTSWNHGPINTHIQSTNLQ